MCDHLTISAASIKEYERFDILSNMASSFALSTTYSNIVCPTGLGDRGYIYAETVMLSDFQHNTNSQYKFVFRADRYENDKSYTTTMTVIVKTVYATQVASVSLLFSANGINMGGTLSSCSGYSRAITEVAFKDRFEWQVNSSGVMLNGYTVCSSDFAANAVSSYYDVMIGHFRNNPITMTHMIPHVEYISQSDLREIRTVRKMG